MTHHQTGDDDYDVLSVRAPSHATHVRIFTYKPLAQNRAHSSGRGLGSPARQLVSHSIQNPEKDLSCSAKPAPHAYQGWDALGAPTGGRASREASKAAEAASQRATRGDIEQDRTSKRSDEQGAGPGPRAQEEGRVDRASERSKRAGRASEGGEKRREPRGLFCKTYFIPSQ
jgi:hypothetical protein